MNSDMDYVLSPGRWNVTLTWPQAQINRYRYTNICKYTHTHTHTKKYNFLLYFKWIYNQLHLVIFVSVHLRVDTNMQFLLLPLHLVSTIVWSHVKIKYRNVMHCRTLWRDKIAYLHNFVCICCISSALLAPLATF